MIQKTMIKIKTITETYQSCENYYDQNEKKARKRLRSLIRKIKIISKSLRSLFRKIKIISNSLISLIRRIMKTKRGRRLGGRSQGVPGPPLVSLLACQRSKSAASYHLQILCSVASGVLSCRRGRSHVEARMRNFMLRDSYTRACIIHD